MRVLGIETSCDETGIAIYDGDRGLLSHVLYSQIPLHADYGGVVNTMPKFAALFMLFTMANAGLPATSGFVGEFMVILAAVEFNFWVAVLAASSLIMGAAYSLWMYKRVIFGAVANKHVEELTDINGREFAILAVLAICTLWMGLYPQPFTEVMQDRKSVV